MSIYEKANNTMCPECKSRLSLDYEESTYEYFLVCDYCGWDEKQKTKVEDPEPVFIPERKN